MGFFNLQVTVVGHASLADISTTTRPFFACPSVPATSMRVGGQPETVQRALPELDAPRPIKHQKRGPRSTPKSWFWTVNPLIRYQDLTPQTLPPNHPQG